MFVQRSYYIQSLRVIDIMTRVLWVLGLLIALSSVVLLFCYKSFVNKQFEYSVFQKEKKEWAPLDLALLKEAKQFDSFYEKDLKQSLVFLGKNTRPDAYLQENQWLIGLKDGEQTEFVSNGDKIYLSYDRGALRFSKEQTPLWLKINGLNKDHLLVDSGLLYTSEDMSEIYQERSRYEKDLRKEANLVNRLDKSIFSLLESAKWWGPDLFYQAYGGVEYAEIVGAERLKVKGVEEILFVKEKDRLFFDGTTWRKLTNTSLCPQAPLAEITSINATRLEMKVWDESGMFSRMIVVSKQKHLPLNIKIEEVFSKIRPRGMTQASCKIAGKTALLKKGIWFIKNGTGWHPIKTWEEIDKYLSYKMKGELFVFDGIEKEKGRTVFKGHLFDRMREQMQDINIPLSTVKQKTSRKKIKPSNSWNNETDIDDLQDQDNEIQEELLRIPSV